MKPCLTLMTFCFFTALSCSFSFAQEKTVKKKIRLSFQLAEPVKIPSMGILINNDRLLNNGERKSNFYTANIKVSYFFIENMSLQIRGGFTMRDIKESSNIYVGTQNQITDVKYRQTWLNFDPGLAWHFQERSIEIFGGIEIPIIIYNKGIQDNNYSERNVSAYFYNAQDHIIIPGGFSVGFGGFAGLNFYLFRNISVSPEFFMGVFYSKLGGDVRTESSYNGSSSGSGTLVTVTQVKLNEFAFSQPSSGFNISFNF